MIWHTQKVINFIGCILFLNINNKSLGYEILKYLKKEKYPKSIHIPFAFNK